MPSGRRKLPAAAGHPVRRQSGPKATPAPRSGTQAADREAKKEGATMETHGGAAAGAFSEFSRGKYTEHGRPTGPKNPPGNPETVKEVPR